MLLGWVWFRLTTNTWAFLDLYWMSQVIIENSTVAGWNSNVVQPDINYENFFSWKLPMVFIPASFVAENSVTGLLLYLCKLPERFSAVLTANVSHHSLPQLLNLFSLTQWHYCVLVGSPPCTVVQKCLQAESWEKYKVHLIYFPSLRDHSTPLPDVLYLKQFFNIFLLVLLF